MSLTKVSYSMVQGAPVNVIDYVSSGAGSDADPYLGWDTAITWSPNTRYVFPEGVFAYASTIDVAKDGIYIQGVGVGTVLKYTGTSGNACLSIDREGLTGVSNVTVEGFLLKGNASTDYGMYIANVRNLTLRDINVVDVNLVGLDINFVVLGLIENYTCTVNAGLSTFMPQIGLRIDATGIYNTTFSTEIIVVNPIIEGVQGDGIILDRCLFSKILNGTSEANDVGVRIIGSGGAGLNVIDGIDCEANATSDFVIGGVKNIIRGVISGSEIADSFIVSGTGNMLDGGHTKNLKNSGVATEIKNFGIVSGGSFTDTGTKTIIYSLYDLVKGKFFPKTDNQANLIFNGSMEAWSAGVAVAPDGWVLSGAGATIARSTTQVKSGTYSAAITRVGTDCVFQQLNFVNEYSLTSLIGKQICFSAWVWASVANTARVVINTISSAATSEYHTGDSTWQLLTVTITVPDNATAAACQVILENTNTTIYVDDVAVSFGSIPLPYVERPVAAAHAVGGVGSAGAGNQYVSIVVDGITYKVLHDN